MGNAKLVKTFDVHLRFKHPAWDMTDGLWYRGVNAKNRREANKQVRRQAKDDGHIETIYLTAHEVLSDSDNSDSDDVDWDDDC